VGDRAFPVAVARAWNLTADIGQIFAIIPRFLTGPEIAAGQDIF